MGRTWRDRMRYAGATFFSETFHSATVNCRFSCNGEGFLGCHRICHAPNRQEAPHLAGCCMVGWSAPQRSRAWSCLEDAILCASSFSSDERWVFGFVSERRIKNRINYKYEAKTTQRTGNIRCCSCPVGESTNFSQESASGSLPCGWFSLVTFRSVGLSVEEIFLHHLVK